MEENNDLLRGLGSKPVRFGPVTQNKTVRLESLRFRKVEVVGLGALAHVSLTRDAHAASHDSQRSKHDALEQIFRLGTTGQRPCHKMS